MKNDPQNPLVSVIIPMFNAQAYIRETVDSVLSQTYKNIEVIVVDDGSTDDSRSHVLSYRNDRIKYIFQNNSGGCSSPRNNGIRHSRGEMVTFFDSDDLMLPGKIESQVDFLKRNPDIDVVIADYVNFDASKSTAESHFKTCPNLAELLKKEKSPDGIVLAPRTARYLLSIENFSIAGSPLLRRSVLDEIGMFDEGLAASEDFDFLYRIAFKRGIGVLSAVGFKRRLHSNNMSRSTLKILNNKLGSRKKMLQTENDRAIRANLAGKISGWHLSLSECYISVDNMKAAKELAKSFYYAGLSMAQIKASAKIILALMGLHRQPKLDEAK